MQFVDQVKISVESGSGGDGIVSWRREKFVAYGGPAGGDGGSGGSVFIEATTDLHTLLDFKYHSQFKAEDGERGRNKNCHGKMGQDLVIKVPCGTIVRDGETNQPIADLIEPGDKIMVALGGRGGRGNSRFVSSKRQAPQFAEPGEPAIARELVLELKLLADVGLLGLPNAGKSTLISVISAAKPKIADYPFTTITPNLGVVRQPSGDGFVVADIPGLIEGASEGVGLGHDFLRHVERTRLLLHLVDVSDREDVDALEEAKRQYDLINRELAKYSPLLAQKPQIVVLTKIDAVADPEQVVAYIANFKAYCPYPVMAISAVAHQGVDALVQRTFETLSTIEIPESTVELAPDTRAFANDDSAFEIVRKGKLVQVSGGKLDRLVRVTDLRNTAATRRMMNIFKAMGVFDELARQGVAAGQTVVVGGHEFEYYPEDVEHY